ncbi:MAG: aldehyde dehydrogenase family protein [Bacteroidota bacterium]|nr:aldehyde dehydrogenase family protein [Bacteroidota bacterium]
MNATYPLYLAGEFITTNDVLVVLDKYGNKDYATTYLADEKVLDYAIKKGIEAKDAMKLLSSLEKYEILFDIYSRIKAKRQHLAEVLCIESAKPIRHALSEVDRSAQTFLIAAEECKRLPKEYMSLDWTPNGKNKEGIVKYFPIGLVAGISPFNFPLNLAVHKIAPAIAAGCPIILKPASSTPLSTLELAKIISETKLPKGGLSILPMDRKTGNLLVTDERINLLSFTGSPEVGWEMKKQCGKKKVVLELGGNAGVIITPSANFEDAVQKCLVGAFAYSGQICIHAQRLYVHESIFEKFKTAMVQKAKDLAFGNPLKQDTEISDMIDEENSIRVENWIQQATALGATLLCGGTRTGKFVEPTILTGTTEKMKVNCEEVFGPVICLESYTGAIENAIKKVNSTKFGLQCGVFTDSVAELTTSFEKIEVGGIIHNDAPTLRFDQMPYGGIKDSGIGREGVKYAINDMLEHRILVK